METNQRKILEMLAAGKITVEEAERLMFLVRPESGPAEMPKTAGGNKSPKYLRIEVRPGPEGRPDEQENVNIRVPFSLLRAGMKLAYVIPPRAYDQVDSALKQNGVPFDLRDIRPEDLEEILKNLNDLEIDVHNGRQKVHIFAE
jgi:hypothetical protein